MEADTIEIASVQQTDQPYIEDLDFSVESHPQIIKGRYLKKKSFEYIKSPQELSKESSSINLPQLNILNPVGTNKFNKLVKNTLIASAMSQQDNSSLEVSPSFIQRLSPNASQISISQQQIFKTSP